MIRKLGILCFIFFLSSTLWSQTSSSFFSLGNATFQNSFYNPAVIPEGKLFIGLPVLSGVHINVNNKFGYRNFIVQSETGGNAIDLNLLLRKLQRHNMVSVSTHISLFHVAVTPKPGFNFSIFANERIEMDFLYPKSLMKFVIDGNATLAGETVKIGKTRFSANYYREVGLGVAAPIPSMGMTVGLRAKYLQGMVNVSTPGSFRANLITDPVDYSLDLEMQNAQLRTSGLGIMQGNEGNLSTHLISNGNVGAAIDLGFTWRMNKYYSLTGSIVDLGFISWKENNKTFDYGDTTMVYSGINLKGVGDLEQTVKDSLINRFKNKKSESTDPYMTLTNPTMYVSWAYKTPYGGELIATGGARYLQTEMKLMMGVGYRHSFGRAFTGSLNVTRLPQQFLNLGTAFAVKGGPAQFYMAIDHLVNFDATRFKAFDLRFGVNLIFGEGKEKGPATAPTIKASKAKSTGSSSQSFLGSKVKMKGSEGIYSIINKQERRERKEFLKKSAPIPNTKSGTRIRNSEPKESNIPNKKVGGRVRNKPPKGDN